VVASVALALPLAFEAKEPDAMSRLPRQSDEPIFGAFVVVRTVVAAALMTAGAIGLLLRDSIVRIGVFSNPAVFIGIATIIALQLAFIYTPFMQPVFGTGALAARDMALTALAAVIILPAIGLEERSRNMTEPRSGMQRS
jgi:magnesium-transporting ATPase (P-type)